MKRFFPILIAVLMPSLMMAQQQSLTLEEAIALAHERSVDASVALNRLKTAYWEYRTHKAEQLPEITFKATAPSYANNYTRMQLDDGSYTYLKNDILSMSGSVVVDQNIPFTGGRLSLSSSLEYINSNVAEEFLSVPVALTLSQPILGVNNQKWQRRIEPVRYREAKQEYVKSIEEVTITTLGYFFNLLLARENYDIALQNHENAERLFTIARAKREIGQISESDLMQLELSALQMKANLTKAQSELNANMFRISSFLAIDDSVELKPVVPDVIPAMHLSYDKVLSMAHTNNPFAENVLRRQLQSDYAVAVSKGNRRQINLYASIGNTGRNKSFSTAYDDVKNYSQVEVGLSIPLVDWGKRKGQVKVAQSNRDVEMSRIRQEEMSFNQNVYLLVENFNNQSEQVNISVAADRIAQQRYNTAIETFMVGQISILDLNDARQSKDNARQKYIEELYYYWNYFYTVRSTTLYDFMADRTLNVDFDTLVRK